MADVPEETLPVGTVLCGKYTIEGVLGVGGMATVYAATHRTGHRVALKMLHPHLALRADVRARFLKEAYTANALDHPGAVRVIDDDEEAGSPFLVMELLEGETLDAWAKRLGTPPHEDVVVAMHDVLDVLVRAHEKGIVHRDLKPENLFRCRDGAIRVLDFGIARALYDSSAQSRTKTGGLLGSPAFMPPEQARGRTSEIDGRTDLWAVGATAFNLLSGRFVHDADTLEMLHVASCTQHAVSIGAVAPGLPPQLVSLFDQALMFDKTARWPDARTMQRALQRAAADIYGRSLGGFDPSASPADDEPPTVALTAALGVEVAGAPSGLPFAATMAAEPPVGAARPASTDPASASPARGGTLDVVEVASAPAPAARRWPMVAGAAAVLGLVGAAILAIGARSSAPVQSAISAASAPTPAAPATEPAPVAATLATASASGVVSATATPPEAPAPVKRTTTGVAKPQKPAPQPAATPKEPAPTAPKPATQPPIHL